LPLVLVPGLADRFVELLELLGETPMFVELLELFGETPMWVLLLLEAPGATPKVVELDEAPGTTRVVESTLPEEETAPLYAGAREPQSGTQSSGLVLLIEAQ
jgi:hypothetical protein